MNGNVVRLSVISTATINTEAGGITLRFFCPFVFRISGDGAAEYVMDGGICRYLAIPPYVLPARYNNDCCGHAPENA